MWACSHSSGVVSNGVSNGPFDFDARLRQTFNELLHHISVDHLEQSYLALERRPALGSVTLCGKLKSTSHTQAERPRIELNVANAYSIDLSVGRDLYVTCDDVHKPRTL